MYMDLFLCIYSTVYLQINIDTYFAHISLYMYSYIYIYIHIYSPEERGRGKREKRESGKSYSHTRTSTSSPSGGFSTEDGLGEHENIYI
jgi:hypothetical protein